MATDPSAGRNTRSPLTGVLGRAQRLGARPGLHWLDVAARVQARVTDEHGNYLAGAISLAAFIALFPLLLLTLSITGFIGQGHTDVAGSVIHHLGLSGTAATDIRTALRTAERSRRTTGLIGTLGLIWSGLGLISALQYAYNQMWGVAGRGAKDRAIGIGWMVGAVALFAAGATVTALIAVLPALLSPLALLAGATTDVALFWWTAKILPNRDTPWRTLVPGAILGGVGLEVLKFVGGFYVPALVRHSSQLYGSIGVAFALLAWLVLFGRLIVYSAALDVVLAEERAWLALGGGCSD